jgi:cyanate permease
MSSAPLLLAHQGGWDEILLILTPISLFAGLLWIANRRANAEIRRRCETEGGTDGETGEGGPEPDGPPVDPHPP